MKLNPAKNRRELMKLVPAEERRDWMRLSLAGLSIGPRWYGLS
jgi:hypothetical protein